nr:MAG TPA: hypothetical protein [Caudoviricetes sp.]
MLLFFNVNCTFIVFYKLNFYEKWYYYCFSFYIGIKGRKVKQWLI